MAWLGRDGTRPQSTLWNCESTASQSSREPQASDHKNRPSGEAGSLRRALDANGSRIAIEKVVAAVRTKMGFVPDGNGMGRQAVFRRRTTLLVH